MMIETRLDGWLKLPKEALAGFLCLNIFSVSQDQTCFPDWKMSSLHSATCSVAHMLRIVCQEKHAAPSCTCSPFFVFSHKHFCKPTLSHTCSCQCVHAHTPTAVLLTVALIVTLIYFNIFECSVVDCCQVVPMQARGLFTSISSACPKSCHCFLIVHLSIS